MKGVALIVMPAPATTRPPHWYTIPVRVFLITFILTLLSFAVCLFVAIIGTVVIGGLHGVTPDMRVVYRHIALPIAAGVACLVLVVSTITEIRHYQQSRALAGIARASTERAT